MNALLLRCRYTFAPVSLLLIFILGFVVASPLSAKAQRTTSTEPRSANHSLHLQFPGEQPRPLSMATGDFDEDGVNDLVIGYALSKGGSIAVLRGNLDANAPQTHESWLAAGRHEYSDPYLQSSEPISVDSRPSLMTAADVNGDGHLDLIFATKGGNQLFALLGDGKGTFRSPVRTIVDGGVTALAAYRPGAPFSGEVLLVGYKSNTGAKLSILSYSSHTWTTQASYSLPGQVTAMSVASLDADSIPDAAIVAGGKLLILHGSTALAGRPALTTLPIDDVESVTAGEFLFDRHAQLQLSVLTTSGDVVTLAHEGFDSRPYTPQQIGEMRRQRRSSSSQAQALAQQPGNTGNEPWVEIERHSGAAVHASGDRAPILLRSRTSGSGGDDLVVVNSSQQQQTVIRHPLTEGRSLTTMVAATPASEISSSNLSTGNIVAAVSAPVTPDARQGLVLLSADNVSPEIITLPSAGNTFYVNTTADNTGSNVDTSDGTRCTQGAGEPCTLRDAVTFINNDAADNISAGTSDTIMVPANTYNLTWQAGAVNGNGDALTHLEILGPVTIIGDTSGSGTVINANNSDLVFAINPGIVGAFNGGANPVVFDAALENLTIENGKNNDASDTTGGCVNWDANGPGKLTITNSIIKNCTALWGNGGGIWAFSTVDGGSGVLTLNGDAVENSSTAFAGGGVDIDFPPVALSATNTSFSNNTASASVNPSAGGVGSGGGLSLTARDSTTTPRTTLTNVTIDSNTADVDGGGIYTTTGILLSGSTIENNSTGRWGGGLSSALASPETLTTITGSNFQGNSATGAGGAIAVGPDTGGSSGNNLQISLSRIAGNTSANGSGIAGGNPSATQAGAGEITATENWWGCNFGPGATGCDTTAQFHLASGDFLIANPYAVLSLSASPTSINQGDSITLTAGVTTDNNNNSISGAFPGVQTLTPTYSTNVVGDTIASQPFSSAGNSTATLTPSSASSNKASVTFDSQTVSANYTVSATTATTLSITAPSITFGQTASISIALTPSNATGITASGFTATIDSTVLTITSTATPNVFILSGPTLASLNAGSHPVQVNFIGTTSYSPSAASASLQVSKATAAVTLGNLTATYDGTAHGVTAATSPVGLAVSFTYNGSSAAPSNAGSYTVVGTINDTNYTGTATSQLVISKATATVTLSTLAQTYNGSAHAATAITTPAGLAVDFTYNGIPSGPTTAGSYTVVGTINDTNYAGSASAQLVINQATLNLAWTPATPIVYGTPLSAAQLNATATNNGSAVTGTFSYSAAFGTGLTAGTHTLTVSFTPSDTTDFSTPAPITATITVTQAAPVLAWTPTSPIVYGTPLSASQFNATATFNLTPIAGTFSYSSTLGTVLGVGIHTLSVSFTPSDTTNYSTPAPIPANITVTPATPVISWSPSSPIAYGTALTPAQLNATVTNNGSAVAGTFSYSPALGTVLTAGTHTLTYTFTPSDTTDYNTPSPITRNIIVNQGTPALAWSSPSPIVSGTALSAAQLNATASYNGTAVAGTFSYNPALGTVLSAGTHTLTATFTPSDTTDYSTPAPITTNLTVQAIPVLAWTPTSPIVYGTPLSPAQFNATATYSGNPVAGAFSYSSPIGTILGVGTHTLTATFTPADTTTYSTPTPITENITVTAATPMLQWATPASITYGAALTGAQLSATATNNGNPVPGTFAYTPALGTVLSAGSHTLSATFIPNDTTDYNTPVGTVSTTITVTPATPTLQWATPASITYGATLTGAQLSATAANLGNPVAGTFAYTPALGTVLSVGSHTLSATFIPNDTTDYKTPAGSVSTMITVTPATPMLQWATPASITYGTALTGTQLNATATNLDNPVSGTFAYTPALGTILSVGSHTLSATFIPNDATDYNTPTGIVSTMITVTSATPKLQWATPASITYGTALTNSQLNATASYNGSLVSGSFTYSPGLGTVLSAGSHTLSVSFTPADTATYGTPAPITTNLTVSQGTLTITANNTTRVYGTANPTFTGAITGELPADSFTESFATQATFDSPVGSYPISPSVTGINLTNYDVTAQSGALTVTPAGSTVTLGTSSITANADANVTLTATVLSATTGVPTGSVQFLDGSTVLGNGVLSAQGVGTYTTSSLASGAHQITAVYAGDTNFARSSSSQTTVTIGSPGYTLLANPASLTLKAGQTGKVSLTFTPVGGFTGTLSLSCTGLPAGASCSFAPSNLTADGSNKQQIAQLTITTLGSNQGTVSMNRSDGSSSGPLRASMFLLPGMFFGGFLMWQRKKLCVRNGQLLLPLILVASLTGMVGCGSSPPTTTLGSSSVVVAATASAAGSGASNAGAAFILTIVE
jgi:CSLREA domain-containing protein